MKNCLCLLALFYIVTINSQVVNNNTELQNAISNAGSGTVIELADGIWEDVQISINVNATVAQPCIIKAQNTGNVFFEGRSNISLGGSYIILEGIIFQNAEGLISSGGDIDPIIEFRDTNNNQCSNCHVRNIKIDSYNGTLSQEEDVFKWITMYGQYNEVSYCSFIGKNGVGSIINDNRSGGTPDYTKIHHNYFADRVPVDNNVNGLNDQDALRIGSSSTSLTDSFTEVYDNLFNNWSGEVEIISNKSGSNKYYNNTFRDYQGTLTLRHGDGCEVYNNYFFANNNPFSGGIRVIGENHKIYNNYIEGANHRKPGGAGSGATGGINVSNGKPNSALNEYYQVKNTQIVNNTLVNCDLAIRVGTMINSTLTLAPENLVVANNIMLNSSDSALEETTAPIGANSIYEGNITQNGSWDLTNGVNSNQTVNSGLLATASNLYRLEAGSAAIDAGIGTYTFLTQDILYGNREANFDAGAEEYGANGTGRPYILADIGQAIGFEALGALSVKDYAVNHENIKVYPIPSNKELNISSDKDPIIEVKIYDISGKLLMDKKIDLNAAKIDVSHLSKGVYILKTANKYINRFVVD